MQEMYEMRVWSLGREDLEEGMAMHSSIHSCLENPMGRGAWWATAHRVAKSQTRLNRFSTHARKRTASKAVCTMSHPKLLFFKKNSSFLQRNAWGYLLPATTVTRLTDIRTLCLVICASSIWRQEQGNLLMRTLKNLGFRHPKRKEKKVTYRSIYFFKDESSQEGTNGYL